MSNSISTDTTVTTVTVTKTHEDDVAMNVIDVVAVEVVAEAASEKLPAWEQFIQALSLAEGVKREDKKSFVKFEGGNGHKIYVAKQADEVKLVETTLEVEGQDGTLPLPKPNGRIACRLVPSPENVSKFLALLTESPQIRAPKRPSKAG